MSGEELGYVLVHRLEHVAIDAHCDADVGVPETLHHKLRMRAEADHERRACMSQVVRAELLGKSGAQQRRAHHLLAEALAVKWSALRGAEDIVVGFERSTLFDGEPREVLAGLVAKECR